MFQGKTEWKIILVHVYLSPVCVMSVTKSVQCFAKYEDHHLIMTLAKHVLIVC